jgi:hypothetical protein
MLEGAERALLLYEVELALSLAILVPLEHILSCNAEGLRVSKILDCVTRITKGEGLDTPITKRLTARSDAKQK